MNMDKFMCLNVGEEDVVTINALELQELLNNYKVLKEEHRVTKEELKITKDTVVSLYNTKEKLLKNNDKLTNRVTILEEEITTLKEDRRDIIKLEALNAKLAKHNEVIEKENSKLTNKLLTVPVHVKLDIKG